MFTSQSLNPFKTVQGNPFLKPSYITSSELIYNASKNELKVYAQRLEEGYSSQAPKGMTEPTIEDIRDYVYKKTGVQI